MMAQRAHTPPARTGWRAAYEAFLRSDDPLFFRNDMLTSLERNRAENAEIAARIRREVNVTGWHGDSLQYDIYALSRLHNLILCHLEPGHAQPALESWFPDGAPQDLTQDDHARFVAALGFDIMPDIGFCPALHEVVTWEAAADPDAMPEITTVFWPCVTIGKLLFARGGVGIRAGRNQLPEAAKSAPLYWSFARRNRRTYDLSDGWGGNSQWSTLPRIDVIEDTAVHLNINIKGAEFPTTPHNRDLLVHRCPLAADAPTNDLWPFDLTGTYIRRTGTLVPYAS